MHSDERSLAQRNIGGGTNAEPARANVFNLDYPRLTRGSRHVGSQLNGVALEITAFPRRIGLLGHELALKGY
jgi:hypothetical protein